MPESIEKARAQALHLLKFRVRSEEELRQRLERKGVSAPLIQTLLEDFKKKGFIDDAKFARYAANQQMFSKPVSRRALLMKLKTKGVSSALAAQAVEQATEGQNDLEVARELAKARLSRLKGLSSEAVQRRLFGFLGRRGFSSDVVYRVVREVSQGFE